MLSKQIPLGIYEKALPAGECWLERLQLAKTLGFDFVEMSVDETDERLSRLDWSREQRLALVNAIVETGVRVPSFCTMWKVNGCFTLNAATISRPFAPLLSRLIARTPLPARACNSKSTIRQRLR